MLIGDDYEERDVVFGRGHRGWLCTCQVDARFSRCEIEDCYGSQHVGSKLWNGREQQSSNTQNKAFPFRSHTHARARTHMHSIFCLPQAWNDAISKVPVVQRRQQLRDVVQDHQRVAELPADSDWAGVAWWARSATQLAPTLGGTQIEIWRAAHVCGPNEGLRRRCTRRCTCCTCCACRR